MPVERKQITIAARTYIDEYRDAEKFFKKCSECPNFGHSWACPPFECDYLPVLCSYRYVTIFVSKIIPPEKGMPVGCARDLFRRERAVLEPQLREKEITHDGRAFAFAGECLYCPEGECTRPQGKPCRHPELVRPSLEAVGFDLNKTTTQLFGLPLLWSTDGLAPNYFVLVCGLFHNKEF